MARAAPPAGKAAADAAHAISHAAAARAVAAVTWLGSAADLSRGGESPATSLWGPLDPGQTPAQATGAGGPGAAFMRPTALLVAFPSGAPGAQRTREQARADNECAEHLVMLVAAAARAQARAAAATSVRLGDRAPAAGGGTASEAEHTAGVAAATAAGIPARGATFPVAAPAGGGTRSEGEWCVLLVMALESAGGLGSECGWQTRAFTRVRYGAKLVAWMLAHHRIPPQEFTPMLLLERARSGRVELELAEFVWQVRVCRAASGERARAPRCEGDEGAARAAPAASAPAAIARPIPARSLCLPLLQPFGGPWANETEGSGCVYLKSVCLRGGLEQRSACNWVRSAAEGGGAWPAQAGEEPRALEARSRGGVAPRPPAPWPVGGGLSSATRQQAAGAAAQLAGGMAQAGELKPWLAVYVGMHNQVRPLV
jgi:hypothetical protein